MIAEMKREFVLIEPYQVIPDTFWLKAIPEMIDFVAAQPWIAFLHLSEGGTLAHIRVDPRYDPEECWLELAYALESFSPFDIWATEPEMRKD